LVSQVLASRRTLRAALVILVLSLAATSSAVARPLVGVQGVSAYESDAKAAKDLDIAKKAHFGAIRVQAFWAGLQPSGPDAYDNAQLAALDKVVDGAAQRGLKVILFADGTPCWASSAPAAVKAGCRGETKSSVYRYGPSDPQTFVALSTFLVQRYGAKLAAYEVWNEPDQANENYWAGPNKVARYVALAKAVYGPLKAVAPQLPVLAGSFVGANGKWLQAMYDAGIKGSYDGLAVHFYDLPLDALKTTRAVQRRNGDAKPQWMTEFGWSSCYRKGGPAYQLEHACLTTSGQARAVADTLRAIAKTSWVKAAVLYTLRDETSAYRFGLVDAKGKAKPLLKTLTALLKRPLSGALPKPRVHLSTRKGRLVATGTGSIAGAYRLVVSGGGVKYAATLRVDRFGRFRVVLPSVVPRTGVSATFRSTWSSSRVARAHR
jgi:hypothetical protein